MHTFWFVIGSSQYNCNVNWNTFSAASKAFLQHLILIIWCPNVHCPTVFTNMSKHRRALRSKGCTLIYFITFELSHTYKHTLVQWPHKGVLRKRQSNTKPSQGEGNKIFRQRVKYTNPTEHGTPAEIPTLPSEHYWNVCVSASTVSATVLHCIILCRHPEHHRFQIEGKETMIYILTNSFTTHNTAI